VKRLVALVVLSLVAWNVAAQPTCWPDLTLPVQFEAKDKPVGPLQKGEVVYAASDVGLVWGYSCTDAQGVWWRVIAGGPWSAFPANWLAMLDRVIRGTDADRSALWKKYATVPIDARLKSDVDAIWAMLPLPPPPPPAVKWVVLADPFRADKRRLVYTVIAGKRGAPASPSQYVDAGAPCDPVTTITELGSTYFLSVLGDPNKVARCVKQ
jgi:hypothetical protein